MIKILRRLERKPKILSEKPYFKNNFKRYYVKESDRGETQFWAHMTVPSGTQYSITDQESYYLGKYRDGWIKPENFYQLPWDVQRSASRLFTKFMENVDNGL